MSRFDRDDLAVHRERLVGAEALALPHRGDRRQAAVRLLEGCGGVGGVLAEELRQRARPVGSPGALVVGHPLADLGATDRCPLALGPAADRREHPADGEDVGAAADHQGPIDAPLRPGELRPGLGAKPRAADPELIDPEDERIAREAMLPQQRQDRRSDRPRDDEAGNGRADRGGLAAGLGECAAQHLGEAGRAPSADDPRQGRSQRLPDLIGVGGDLGAVLVHRWQRVDRDVDRVGGCVPYQVRGRGRSAPLAAPGRA